MGKKRFDANFDEETYLRFEGIVGKGKVANVLQSFMENVVCTGNQSKQINLKLLNLNIDKEQKFMSDHQAKLRVMLQQRDTILKEKQDEEEKKLLLEKVRIEKTTYCLGCKGFVSKDNCGCKTEKGIVCKRCFFNQGMEKQEEWGITNLFKTKLKGEEEKKVLLDKENVNKCIQCGHSIMNPVVGTNCYAFEKGIVCKECVKTQNKDVSRNWGKISNKYRYGGAVVEVIN